ncbi:MAG: hypothetical protein H0U16_11740 [Actinobacteria bacterium]|nr:hypothetical protein [Actinomycetota bacterium]
MAGPRLLAGPIIRRAEARVVHLWLATDAAAEISAHALGVSDGDSSVPIGSGGAESLRIGRRLYVHLITMTPEENEFPTDELLYYDVLVKEPSGDSSALSLRDFGVLEGDDRITYGDLSLPTFFIRKNTPSLELLHGSCRLLHGKGEDSLLSADEIIARHATDVVNRPCAMIFTGDQIYADEVAGPMIVHVRSLATELFGEDDETSVPGVPRLSTIPPYGRQDLTVDMAHFTSDKAGNHLMSFGEFGAIAVVAWNGENWPDKWPRFDDVIPTDGESRSATLLKKRKYEGEIKTLERARAAMPAVRRVLANVPTYMIFDDHDVTDDWNLTQSWRERVKSSATGRHIVANALASYWAFQGWGNNPEVFDNAFKDIVTGRLTGGETDPKAYEETLWSFNKWSYSIPTSPPTIVLDTRTQRTFDSPEGAARLIGPDERRRVATLARDAGHKAGNPLIIVSPVPVFGLELQERRQKFLVNKVGPYEIDFEAWHSNLQGMLDFMELLMVDLEITTCVLLSGDVHYGLNAKSSFEMPNRKIAIAQLVSSSQKHSGELSKAALNLLGKLVSKDHERVGWSSPPKTSSRQGLKERIIAHPANTDDWSDDSPVFLAANRVEQLGIETPPEYREFRSYVATSGPDASMVIGENNIGLVSLRAGEVVHHLLSRDKGETKVHTATISLDPSRANAG